MTALPAGVGALDRGTPSGPSLVQTLELEQAFGELVFEGDEGFGGGGHGGGSWPEIGRRGHLLVTRERRGLGGPCLSF